MIAPSSISTTIIWHREYKSRQYFIPSATVNNNNGVDWITASTLCRSTVSGANLVSMITDTLQIFLQFNLPTAYHYWTNGISTVSYRWASGEFLLPNIRAVGIDLSNANIQLRIKKALNSKPMRVPILLCKLTDSTNRCC